MIPSSGPELSGNVESQKFAIVVHASPVKLSDVIGAFRI
jgi:hypothetical protein